VQHDRVAVTRAIPILARAVDGIDTENPLALVAKTAQVARGFFGFDPAAANGRPHVAKRGYQELLDGEVGQGERVGVRDARVLATERDVVTPKLPRESARPSEDPRQVRGEEPD